MITFAFGILAGMIGLAWISCVKVGADAEWRAMEQSNLPGGDG